MNQVSSRMKFSWWTQYLKSWVEFRLEVKIKASRIVWIRQFVLYTIIHNGHFSWAFKYNEIKHFLSESDGASEVSIVMLGLGLNKIIFNLMYILNGQKFFNTQISLAPIRIFYIRAAKIKYFWMFKTSDPVTL